MKTDSGCAEVAAHAPSPLGYTKLFLTFLGFGALAFGGPVAQIAMLRQALVEEQRWIDPARFNRLLAVLQLLPGPEAHELCVHLGMIARGRLGGLLAGLGFMLPGFALMLLSGWIYVSWIAGDAAMAKILLGVQVVVLAIIVRAVFRIGQHIIEDRWLAGIAVASLSATLFGVAFWIPLIVGGVGYRVSHRRIWVLLVVVAGTGIAAAVSTAPAPFPSTAIEHGGTVTLAALFLAGLKGGLLTFGGAYTAIPYVRADTVGKGWIEDPTFLDGVAIAGILPAPLVIFATFVGYVAGGFSGAVAITIGMFLPAFAFSLIFYERLEALVESPALHRALAGVAAAVVGIITATCVQLMMATADRVSQPAVAALLFLAALIVAWFRREAWITPIIVLGGALCGALVAM